MNIEAAKAVADAVRTSLGPRGMDKMVSNTGGVLTIQPRLLISAQNNELKLHVD